MKQSEVDFSEEYKKELECALIIAENEPFFKNTTKFIKKFKMGISNADVVDWVYKLLKNEFERLYPNLNFEEKWKKVTYEYDEKFSVTAYDEIIALGV